MWKLSETHSVTKVFSYLLVRMSSWDVQVSINIGSFNATISSCSASMRSVALSSCLNRIRTSRIIKWGHDHPAQILLGPTNKAVTGGRGELSPSVQKPPERSREVTQPIPEQAASKQCRKQPRKEQIQAP